MNNHYLKLIALLLFTFSAIVCFSQDYDKNLFNQFIPADPTSSSLGKYGVYPVNYSTGLVPITIPLYEVKSGELTQMIELSYHGGGIQVSEEATWVGLGWDLNFGGVITRTMNGFPDESETYPLPDATSMLAEMKNNTDFSNLYYYDCLSSGFSPLYSFKPDLYQYNFGKYSGTFISKSIGNELVAISVSHSALKGYVSSKGIEITDPTGILYSFGGKELTSLIGLQDRTDPYYSGYYIDEIISANQTDTIRYEYQSDGYYESFQRCISQGYKVTDFRVHGGSTGSCGTTKSSYKTEMIPEQSKMTFIQKVSSSKPQYIYFNEGRIRFVLTDREDLNPEVARPNKKLSDIVIESKTDAGYEPVRAFHFYYSYFNQGGSYESLRLCLDSVAEIPYDQPAQIKLVAAFSYYGNKYLPDKETNLSGKLHSSDYWGFYNGTSSGSAIPLTMEVNHTFGGADLTPDPFYAQYGSIRNILQPTRGRTEFVWEGNRVNADHPIYIKPEMDHINLKSEDATTFICENPADPYHDGIFTYTFHSYIDQYVTLNYYLYQEVANNLTHNKYDSGSIKINGDIIVNSLNTGTDTKKLNYYLSANQDYTFEVSTNCHNVKAALWCDCINYNPNKDKYNYPFAGIRIKEVNNYDSGNRLITQKRYTYLDSLGYSSGYMTNDRRLSFINHSLYLSATAFPCATSTKIDTYLYYSTLRQGPQGNNYAYEQVQEYSLSNGVDSGYTNYKFRKEPDLFYADGIPVISKGHLRGQMLRQSDFKRVDNGYQKIKETFNYYSKDPRVTTTKTGFSMPRYIDPQSGTTLDTYVSFRGAIYLSDIFQPTNYTYTSDWIRLDSTTTREYLQTTNPVENKTVYTYGNERHLQPSEVKSYLNNGDIKITNTVYPNDDNSSISGDMVLKNMLVLPIDIREYVSKNGTLQHLVDGNKLTYTKDADGHILLTKVSIYLPDGIVSDEFKYGYNTRARLIQTTTKDSVKMSIVWDANNYKPMVIGKNISHADLTGALKTVNNDPAALYTSQDSRLKNAQINTFKYIPLIGLQSKTDEKGMATYYSYDGLGRLNEIYLIENGQKKVLQSYDYHYKQ
jgi:hypothetical protein